MSSFKVSILVLLCAAVAVRSQLENTEVSADFINQLELEDIEPEGCPGIDGCLHNCPLGRVRDDQGCRTCTCKHTGDFEGDIQVSEKDYWRLEERYDRTAPTVPPKRKKRGAYSLAQSEWPRKGDIIEVPYVYETTITGNKKKRIEEAIAEYNSRTCIRWVPRTDQADYVEFVGTGGCSSHVGRIRGPQKLYIGRNCENRLGTVVHEMLHALGFWHEQSRGDRDDYVNVKWGNIHNMAKANFKKQERFWNNYGSPYDINSVMHYGGKFFSNGKGPTITNKDGIEVVPQRDNFSPEDVHQLNVKYKCTKYIKADRPALVPMMAPACTDEISSSACELYEKRGYCKYSNFRLKCKSTCKTCKSSTPSNKPSSGGSSGGSSSGSCKDTSKNCKALQGRGYCKSSKATMGKFCKKTCNLCGASSTSTCKNTNPKCKQWAGTGYCKRSSHLNFMKRACAKECGFCADDVPLPEPVLDMIFKE